MKHIIIAVVAAAVTTAPAYALQYPKPGKKDGRMWTAIYEPDNPIKIIGAPDHNIGITFPEDFVIERVKGDDSDRLGASYPPNGNRLSLRFNGCFIPQSVIVYFKDNKVQVFEVETKPRLCWDNPKKHEGTPPVAQVAARSGQTATDADTFIPSLGPPPNLRRLETQDDLAEGGRIPFYLTVYDPAGDRKRKVAEYAAGGSRRRQQQAENLLAATQESPLCDGSNQNYQYKGRGDQTLKPFRACDDGYTTKLRLPGLQEFPIVNKLGNLDAGCGPNGEESVADPKYRGDMMILAGIAAGWCLRGPHGKVYEVRNLGYNMYGNPPVTGTISRDVERVVKGAAR